MRRLFFTLRTIPPTIPEINKSPHPADGAGEGYTPWPPAITPTGHPGGGVVSQAFKGGNDQMRKKILGFCTASVTIVTFLWTSSELVRQGNIFDTSSIFARILVTTFVAFVATTLVTSIIAVVLIMPLNLLLGGQLNPKAVDDAPMAVFWGNTLLAFILIWIQFFLFGDCVPFCLF